MRIRSGEMREDGCPDQCLTTMNETSSVFHYYRGTSVGACAGLELLQSQARDVRPCQCSRDLARFSLLRSPRARHLFPGSDQGQYKVRRKDVSSRIAEQLSGKSSG